jgi:NAD(P)-dependent dehydrogenase (short-subunit alcohol dehydrogenase family)
MNDAKRPVAVITGAANGIGLATALELGRRGYSLVIADRDGGGAEAAARAASGDGMVAFGVTVDVTDTHSVERMVSAAHAKFGALDLLVNNAGVPGKHVSARMSDVDWLTMLDVNLHGAFRCARAAYPLLCLSRSPAIVNVGSIAGLKGMAGRAGYGAAKAGISGLTRALATEWAPDRIRVNAIAPGYVRTAGFVQRVAQETAIEMERLVPLGRLGAAEEMAKVICFLASEDASYVTGQTIVVDGGVSIAVKG